MKHLLIFVLVLLTACSTKTKNETVDGKTIAPTRFGQELVDVGFLKFADSTKLDSLRTEVINSFYIYDDANYKITHVDAEELAEFSFDFFVPSLNKMLERRGFRLDVATAGDYEDTHDIVINGKRIRLYSKDELDNGKSWESAPSNFFREVNKQLDENGIDESFYLLYTGNDLHVLLITEDEREIIANNYKHVPKEIPYVP
ncbi:hypothetical protein [Chryseosolibacter indicus]|uniref:Lipoprotein n=1 Tax=Chryseosolibacter indicus TaxID=2782351 RepID=A0ABS5VZU7_9BACT|nr:hypothetical protein [Chryseosolibacter indicus]MBT1706249.1 hypothetical protein [Chryseosolibacter indicus]